MVKCNFVKHMRIAAVLSSDLEIKLNKIRTATGESFFVQGGYIIQLLSETFRFSYDVILNAVIGDSTSDGNWTGCIGRVQRKEADIAICSIGVTEERNEVVAFTHPYMYTPVTFVTDKPQYIPNRFAIFHTFSWHIWLALALCFLFMSFLSYMFFRKKQNYSVISLHLLGISVEQSFEIKSRLSSSRLIMVSWIIGAMCLSYSYKAVLLGSFTVPTLSGVRDIKDFSKAAENPSFHCIADKHSYIYKSLIESDSELMKPISKCLKRSSKIYTNVNPFTFLFNSSYKKAGIHGKNILSILKKKFFISDDTFFTGMVAVAVSKEFRCFDALNDAILKIYEAGLIQKYESDREFLFEMIDKSSDYNNSPNRILKIDDLCGAFIILIAGLLLSILILMIEIIFYRLTKSRKKKETPI